MALKPFAFIFLKKTRKWHFMKTKMAQVGKKGLAFDFFFAKKPKAING